jgi:ribosomal protein L21E
MYGYAPNIFGIAAVPDTPVTDLSSWLADRTLHTELIRQHLLRAKQRMKKSADLHRSERQFHLGDWVYLKLQPYVQSSVADRSHHKLAFRFFGPYRVIGKVGTVAYRLELPPSSSVHPVFHVSQLKKAVGAHQSVTAKPPSATTIWSVPERIIQRRLLRQGTSSILQGLIKWSHLSESLATWEELEALRQQFPRALVWEHLGAQGGGSVSGDPADGMTTTKEEGEAGTAEAQEDAGRKPRSKKKNMRLFGPEWKNE